MEWRVVVSAGLVWVALWATPPVAAFDGGPYVARGTALLEGQAFAATLRWSGITAAHNGVFRIELRDPGTDALVHTNAFLGWEDLSHFQFDGVCTERQEPYWATSVAVAPVLFTITGWQRNNLCQGTAEMYYQGHYLAFELHLWVWGPPVG